jgi:hypothetical protein
MPSEREQWHGNRSCSQSFILALTVRFIQSHALSPFSAVHLAPGSGFPEALVSLRCALSRHGPDNIVLAYRRLCLQRVVTITSRLEFFSVNT